MNVRLKNIQRKINKTIKYTCRNTIYAKDEPHATFISLYNVGNSVVVIQDSTGNQIKGDTFCEYRHNLFETIINYVGENGLSAYELVNRLNNACLFFVIFSNGNVSSYSPEEGNSYHNYGINQKNDDREIIRRVIPFIDFTELKIVDEE